MLMNETLKQNLYIHLVRFILLYYFYYLLLSTIVQVRKMLDDFLNDLYHNKYRDINM